MEEEFERAQALLTRYEDELRNLLPADAEIFDAHVHLGHDIDGQIGVYEELERHQRRGRGLALLHVLHGRAGPPPGVPSAERPYARVREAL